MSARQRAHNRCAVENPRSLDLRSTPNVSGGLTLGASQGPTVTSSGHGERKSDAAIDSARAAATAAAVSTRDATGTGGASIGAGTNASANCTTTAGEG